MKSKTLRIIIPLALMALVAFGFAANVSIGTFAAFGWQDIALLCPIGALSSMLASKLFIPRAAVSIVIAIVLILVIGRAFCAWACPVPVIEKLRGAFEKKGPKKQKTPVGSEKAVDQLDPTAELSPEELASLKSCGSDKGCSTCAEKRAAVDSRHFVLGGALASAAIFGFPVFCLICPIGLTFATILLVMRLFSDGDVTWAVVVVPALLAIEVVFFRKWCSKICPLSAFMSLIAKLNKTFKPVVKQTACLETTKGASCERCVQACPEGINIRHPELGSSMSECTRCRACVDACPAHAVSIPFVARKDKADKQPCMAEAPSSNKKGDRDQ